MYNNCNYNNCIIIVIIYFPDLLNYYNEAPHLFKHDGLYLSNETLKQLKQIAIKNQKEDDAILNRLIQIGEIIFFDKKNGNLENNYNLDDKSVVYDKLLTDWEVQPEAEIQISAVDIYIFD